MPSVIDSRCTRCGACLEECPTRAIVPAAPRFAIDTDLCDSSGLCIPACPEQAIALLTLNIGEPSPK